MTPRERFRAAVRHQPTDRVPQLIRLSRAVEERLAPRYGATGPELGLRLGNDAVVCQIGINADMEMSSGDLPDGAQARSEWGVTYRRSAGFNQPVAPPLRQRADLAAYAFPDPRDSRRADKVRRMVATYGRDHAVVVDLSSSLLEAAMAHLRGMEDFLLDCHDDPAWAGALLDRLADHGIALGRMAIAAGADVVRIGDDVGTQRGLLVPPPVWRALVKPRLARMVGELRAASAARGPGRDATVLYHSCGDISAIVPDLVEIGVQMLSTLQPVGSMDLAALKRDFGRHLAFKGGLDTQRLLPHGTPAEVAAGVRGLLDLMSPGGGYVFMPAHLVYADVPDANLFAMLAAVRAHG